MKREDTTLQKEDRLTMAFSDFTSLVINRKIKKYTNRYLVKNRNWLWLTSLESIAEMDWKEEKGMLDKALETEEMSVIISDLERFIEDERILIAFSGMRKVVIQCIFLNVLIGLSDREVAQLLHLSPNTVKAYRIRGLKEAKERIMRHGKGE